MNSRGKEVDRLSSLAYSFLAHILSFPSAGDTVRTCLVRAFGDLWTTIDSLDFDDGPFWESTETESGKVVLTANASLRRRFIDTRAFIDAKVEISLETIAVSEVGFKAEGVYYEKKFIDLVGMREVGHYCGVRGLLLECGEGEVQVAMLAIDWEGDTRCWWRGY
ncbi:hypothetical protein Cgig2_027362 [Carnegiea gigantea]|uniref:Uncharacterized protein n=1 Tax=Carnegiea gigantea TaxID=171969 RepID=A0A9Q1GNV4_9CARY|nr:hypothetical protein Cgig2_027362 [Carnegiea gigantea]